MNNYRYESKFVFRLIDENSCFKRFIDAGLPLEKHYPERVINNIYFDDNNFTLYSDNLSGKSKRKKLRFRWYGNEKIHNKGNLELKLKDNNLGSKIIDHNISVNKIFESRISEVKKQILEHVDNKYLWYILKQYLNPTIFNSYRRSYYKIDRNIRVTFDRLICTKFLKGSKNILESLQTRDPSILIIEIKCDVGSEKVLREYIGRLGMTRTRYSKYASGLINSYRNGIHSNLTI